MTVYNRLAIIYDAVSTLKKDKFNTIRSHLSLKDGGLDCPYQNLLQKKFSITV